MTIREEKDLTVLLVTSNFPMHDTDPTTPIVANIAHELHRQGVAVHVLTPHGPGATLRDEVRGVKVHRFRYFLPTRLQRLIGGGSALNNLKQHPLLWLQVPFYHISLWWNVRAAIRSGRYDLVHSHWVIPQGFVVELAQTGARIPHIVSVHGGDIFTMRSKIVDLIRRWTFERVDLVTVNSGAVMRVVGEIARLATKPVLLRQGVSMGLLDEDRVAEIRLGCGAGEPLILFVGRLVSEKGVGDLVTAMARVVEDRGDAHLLIVGDGQDRPTFEQQVADLGLDRHVTFVGWVGRSEIPNFLAAADVFVGPSRRGTNGWVEAQGLVFAEALAAGTPVVATDSGGISEVVEDGISGLLVPESSPDAIAKAILSILEDGALADRLVSEGKRTASNLSIDAVVGRLIEVYRDLVG